MNADSADTEQIWALLRKHVPEVTSGLLKVKGITREPGHSVLVVASRDPRGDPVGICIGPKGARVKRIVSELGGEKIDIIRWDESAERFIANLVAPLQIVRTSLEDAPREARVTVKPQSGSRPRDLRLQSEVLMSLTGWKLLVEVQPEPQPAPRLIGITGALRELHRNFTYQPLAEPEEVGNSGRIRWVEGRPGEAPEIAGTDFVIARDGQIAAVYVFFDKLK